MYKFKFKLVTFIYKCRQNKMKLNAYANEGKGSVHWKEKCALISADCLVTHIKSDQRNVKWTPSRTLLKWPIRKEAKALEKQKKKKIMSIIIIDAIQHLFWYSWVLYFISVFIIICGWGPSVAHAFAIASLCLFPTLHPCPGVVFFLSSPSRCLRRCRLRRQEQRQRRWQLPAIVLISAALSWHNGAH